MVPSGLGTALKPAHEPIVMARKPLVGTVAANVLQHGTGAMNIDGCRIGWENDAPNPATNPLYRKQNGYAVGNAADGGSNSYSLKDGSGERPACALGRWPANVLLDEDAAAMLDAQSGKLTSGDNATRRRDGAWGAGDVRHGGLGRDGDVQTTYGDTGGASRFFYAAKASRSERNEGCESPGPQFVHGDTLRKIENKLAGVGNHHPTVKPVDLMRWLVRLVTPPGGIVLDPFTGSGSTGMAAIAESMDFIGIEREADYLEIARRRIASVAPMFATEAAS